MALSLCVEGMGKGLEVVRAVVGSDSVNVVDVVMWRDGHVIGELPDGAVHVDAVESVLESHVALAEGNGEARSKAVGLAGERSGCRLETDSAELTLPGASGLTTGPIQRWRGQGSLQVRRPLAEGARGRRI